jgi:hypothetical protein
MRDQPSICPTYPPLDGAAASHFPPARKFGVMAATLNQRGFAAHPQSRSSLRYLGRSIAQAFNNPFRHICHSCHCKTSGKLSPSSDLTQRAASHKVLTMHNLAIYTELCMAASWGSSPATPAILRVLPRCTLLGSFTPRYKRW